MSYSSAPHLTAELKAYGSPDLEFGKLPLNTENCEIRVEAAIGPPGTETADRFFFTAITPRILYNRGIPVWGRGYLILPRFTWPILERSIWVLIARYSAPSWQQLATLLNRDIVWEHDYSDVIE